MKVSYLLLFLLFLLFPANSSAEERLELAGTWDVTATLSEDRKLESVYTFEPDGEKLKGHAATGDRRVEFESVSVQEGEVTIAMKTEFERNPIAIEVRAKAESPDKLVGRWRIPGEDGEETSGGDWAAVRRPPTQEPPKEISPMQVLGDWKLLVKFGETETDYVLVIKEGKEHGLTGTLVSPRSGEHAFDSVSFSAEEGSLDMKITRDYEGNAFSLHYTGKLSSDGKLAGEVGIVGNDAFKGSWNAVRKSEETSKEAEARDEEKDSKD